MENSSQDRSLKPTKTEYKGICYRSKCEAMFALWLELDEREFLYEPAMMLEGGWSVDFLTWTLCRPLKSPPKFIHSIPLLFIDYIEYKPLRPTDAYCNAFSKRSEEWLARYSMQFDAARRASFAIYYGSAYSYIDNKDSCGVIYFENGNWGDVGNNWVEDRYQHLLNYRFDLESK